MDHRKFIQGSIVVVIATVILWSIVNVSHYARIFHDSAIVWTLGSVIGAANAISVYSFVIAKSWRTKSPSAIGVLLFGCMSGALQMLLYLHDSAPLASALVFGWFGPIAEGVLSWLHAALTEESLQLQIVTVADKPRKAAIVATENPARLQAVNMQPIAEIADQELQTEVEELQPEAPTELPSHVMEAHNMKANGMTIAEIAIAMHKSERTISNYLKVAKNALQLPQPAIHRNGNGVEVLS